MDKLLLNSLINKMEFLEAHNKNYNKTQYNCVCDVLETLKNERLQILKNEYLKKKKLSFSKINFDVFDNLEKITEKDFKILRFRALKIYTAYTGNHKEIFNNQSCFISSSSLNGFYFPNGPHILKCICFIDGKAILILNDEE